MNTFLLLIACFAGDPDVIATGKQKAVTCMACHGVTGRSTTPNWPHLAGQNQAYLEKQLRDYKTRTRDHGLMARMTDPLSYEDIAQISAYLADLPPLPPLKADASRGERVFRRGAPERGVPPCAACHGPNGEGFAPLAIPSLAGQRGEYIRIQIMAFRRGVRTNDTSRAMAAAVKGLKYSEILAVARWLSDGVK